MADYDNTRRRLEKIRKTFEHLYEQNIKLVEKNERLRETISAYKMQADARERVLKSLSETNTSLNDLE